MNKTTVLIVEDEAIIAADLTGKLGQLGYEVVGTAATGEDAIDLACSLKPQIVLMDIRLKDPMDGIEAAETISSRFDVPVIYLTAHSDAATLARAKLTGPFGYILKPFEERELSTNIEMALYKHQSDRQLRKACDELELRVEERTRELTLANAYNRSLIEASLDPLVTIGHDGKITDVNAATEAATGLSLGELIGTDFCDYFSEPDKARAGYQKVFTEGSVRDYALDLRHRDGHLTSVLYNASVYRDERGEVIGVFAAARDITEQKKAQVALKELNEELEGRVIERTAQLNSANEKLHNSHRAALNLMEDAVIARKEAEETSDKLRLEIAERKRVEEELRSSEEKLRLFIEHAPAGLAMFDREMRYVHVSRRWRDDYKLGDRDLLGVSHYEIFPKVPQAWREAHRRGMAGEVLRAEADRFVRADGTIQWIRWEIRPWRDATGDVGGIVIFAEDITEIKQAELELVRLNKALQAMSDSSQAVIRAEDEREYLDRICRIILEDCGYSMVWIGFAENDEAKSVRPVACAGFEEGYLETLKVTWADTERGRGPTGTAIRTGKAAMCRNMLVDPAFTPWRAEALKRGYASSIVFPLVAGKEVLGAITIYSPETDPFSESEVKLLAELADNVLYGIKVLRIKDAQKQAVEALGERERSLAEIVQKSPSFVCILRGPEHVYEMANQKYFQLVGERDIMGKKVVEALPEVADTPYLKILDRVYHTGEPFSENNASIMLARGPEGKLEEAWLDFIYLPLRESDGTISGIFVHGIDLTERKRAEEELRHAKVAAEAASHAKSQFLANMSHELRTPMTGVLGMLEFTLKTQLDVQQRDHIETAHRSARTLLRILNDILDLAKIEAGKLSIERRPLALADCVAGAVDILIPEARRKGLKLNCTMADDLPKTVEGDQVRLLQVLTNLCGNAVKFTDKGQVEVKVTADGENAEGKRKITFAVADTGIGIPDDKKELIFGSFDQADISHTRRFGGTGLGLAISRELVERMGGTISCKSKEGKGSTFSFTLPFAEVLPKDEAAVKPVTMAPPPVQSVRVSSEEMGKARLLLAEDDPITRQVIGLMLKHANFDHEVAENGLRAVEMWEKGNYDLILMDVQMPGQDGFAATGVIRERERERGGHTLIVAMTAHAFPEDEKRCLDAGMDAYIPKPIDLQKCIAMIEELVCKRELEA